MVQSRVVSPETKPEDVASQFIVESPDLVKEFKLQVKFVDLPKPPLLVGEDEIQTEDPITKTGLNNQPNLNAENNSKTRSKLKSRWFCFGQIA